MGISFVLQAMEREDLFDTMLPPEARMHIIKHVAASSDVDNAVAEIKKIRLINKANKDLVSDHRSIRAIAREMKIPAIVLARELKGIVPGAQNIVNEWMARTRKMVKKVLSLSNGLVIEKYLFDPTDKTVIILGQTKGEQAKDGSQEPGKLLLFKQRYDETIDSAFGSKQDHDIGFMNTAGNRVMHGIVIIEEPIDSADMYLVSHQGYHISIIICSPAVPKLEYFFNTHGTYMKHKMGGRACLK